jgi:hypothetical protein
MTEMRSQHYCVITHGGSVISTGSNRNDGFLHHGKDYRCHAECEALRKLPKKYYAKGIKGGSFSC